MIHDLPESILGIVISTLSTGSCAGDVTDEGRKLTLVSKKFQRVVKHMTCLGCKNVLVPDESVCRRCGMYSELPARKRRRVELLNGQVQPTSRAERNLLMNMERHEKIQARQKKKRNEAKRRRNEE